MRRLVVLVIVCGFAARAAASYDVDRTDDSAAATACTAASNDCSLRGAILAANANPGPDTINLPAGTYALSLVGAGEDAAATGDLDLRGDLAIVGAGSSTTIVDGSGIDRVFHADPAGTGITVTIQDLTVQNGATVLIGFVLSYGGAILNGTASTIADNSGGTLTLTNCVVQSSSTPRDGGGIANAGTLTLFHTVVSGNTAAGNGGGITQEDAGSLTITDSTISGNQAAQGGGLFIGYFSILASPVVSLVRSTVSGNLAPATGGIFYNRGSLAVANSTVSGNQGVGIQVFSNAATIRNCTITGNGTVGVGGSPTIANTILAGNNGASGDCAGSTLTSAGYNLIQNATACTINGSTTGNVLGQDPQLGTLADNGGPTKTHALPHGSPALDAGNPAAPGSGGFS